MSQIDMSQGRDAEKRETTMTYTCHEESGHSEDIDADSMDEAVKMAREMARNGDWGHEGATVEVWVTEEDEDGEETDRRSITVEIEPNHEHLICEATRNDRSRSCGDDPDDHDWTSEGEGGCDSNPGVWSTGGTSFHFASHCRTCGLHRTEYTCGSQRNPGDHDRTEYEMPDSWCAECEREECRCEYRLVETVSGWAVERREDGAKAEFLDRSEAEEAVKELRSGHATDDEYEWDCDEE